jgi:HK97 family phage portal protein
MNWRRFIPTFRTEQKSTLAVPDDALFQIFNGAVTVDQALKVPAIACAVRTISEILSTLPIVVNQINADGTRTPVPADHPVQALLSGDWNGWTSNSLGLCQVTADALISDLGGLVYVNRVNGVPAELIHYRTGTWFCQRDVATGEPQYRIGDNPVSVDDVINIQSPLRRSPLTLAREAICLAAVLETYATKLFTNGGKPSGVLSLKGSASADAIANIRTAWQAAHGNGKSGGTAIVGSEATYSQLTLSSVDAQFQEMRSFQIWEIARMFRLPPHMLYDLGRATWANTASMGLEFLSYTLRPWLDQWEAALRRALFAPEDRPRYEVCFQTDDLTQADISARAVAYASLIASRVVNPNEVRAWEGLPPYAAGNEFINPAITPNTPPKSVSDNNASAQ